MRRAVTVSFVLSLLLLVTGCLHEAKPVAANTLRATSNLTPLDQYVAKPDPNFKFKVVNKNEGEGWTSSVLDMTSQQWRTAAEVDKPIWQHYISVVKPNKVKTHTALLVIGGGNNSKNPPKGGESVLRNTATETNSVVAMIYQIPNQPLKFADLDGNRSEDGIIAYTWDKFLRTGDAEWLLRLPMTKAVVRAMDAIQQYSATKEGGRVKIDNFVIAGASKRGWTTWTVSAVDNRVIACVPMVIDLLNIVPSFKHHYEVYGGWAPFVGDYSHSGIMDWIGSKEFDALAKIVEPYNYRDRLTMPKLIMSSCGDQFFLPDSWKYYLKDLQGPTYVRYVPNTGHPLNNSAIDSVCSFYHSIITNTPLPQYTWKFLDENTVRVETSSKPTAVKLWQATNPKERNFRIDDSGAKYVDSPLKEESPGVYIGHVEKPAQGWTAYLVELTYKGPGKSPIRFTTPVQITPDTVLHKFEEKEHPKGFLSK